MTATQSNPRSRQLVRAAFAVVVALTVLDDWRRMTHRLSQLGGDWWYGVEVRERRKLRSAELALLARMIARRQAGSGT
jgi:uncharacterized membrane protein YdbT with pleckstrin-like domain